VEIESGEVGKARASAPEPAPRGHLRVAAPDERAGGDPGQTTTARTTTRVLVVGTDEWAIDRAITGLDAQAAEGQQFEIFRCHEPGTPVFPCNALRPGGICPVVAGIDVVATVRARPLRSLAESEFGVICALREEIPLVVSGISPERPLKPWASAVVEYEGDLGSACANVVGATSDPAATPEIEVQQGGV
jgi:hypothetical protein